MYEVSVKSEVKAGHQLRYYDGKCERVHGHNWKIEVIAQNRVLDKLGVVVDFNILKEKLDEVLKPFDHRRINCVEPFDEINPSAENLAHHIYNQLIKFPEISESCQIKRVNVGEDLDFVASYIPD